MDVKTKEEKLKALGIDIRSVLISFASKGGCTFHEADKNYKELNFKSIPFRDFGFSSLESLFMELSKQGYCTVMGGMVYPRASQETAHQLRLVQGQKKQGKKGSRGSRGKGTRGMSAANLKAAYGLDKPARVNLSTCGRTKGGGAGCQRRQTNSYLQSYGFDGLPMEDLRHKLNGLGGGSLGMGVPSLKVVKTSLPGSNASASRRFVSIVPTSQPLPRPKPSAKLEVKASPDTRLFKPDAYYDGGSSVSSSAHPQNHSGHGISDSTMRQLSFHLKTSQHTRNRRDTTTPASSKQSSPNGVASALNSPPPSDPGSPTPSLPAGPPRPRSSQIGRFRWMKGHVNHLDDWSKEWQTKPQDAGKRAGRKWMEVGLAQYESLGCLHLIKASSFDKLRELEKAMSEAFADRNKAPTGLGAMEFWLPMNPRELKPGLHTAVHVKLPDDLGYNRAEVIEVKGKTTLLRCLDYGSQVEIPSDRIHHLPAHLATTPKCARTFRCYGWDAEVFYVPDEDKLENFVLRFCNVEGLATIRLVADFIEDGAVNLFREDKNTGEWLELAEELMKIGYVVPRKTSTRPVNSVIKQLSRVSMN